jgi:flavin reductase (DIM6/NTAB) family NADH-FMN oxidoreductase RutF
VKASIMNLHDNFPAVESDSLRIAMRQWTTGVAIISSFSQDDRHGMTVSSFTPISLAPPLVSISIARDTHTHRLITASGYFGVTILSAAQQELSDRFAGRIEDQQDRFKNIETFTLRTGTAFIAGGLVWLDCEVVSTFEAGNNTIFLGKVVAIEYGTAGEPLLYYDRNYQTICD